MLSRPLDHNMVSAKKQGASAKTVKVANVEEISNIRKRRVRKPTKKVGLPLVEQEGNAANVGESEQINPVLEVTYLSELEELRQISKLQAEEIQCRKDQVLMLQRELSRNSNIRFHSHDPKTKSNSEAEESDCGALDRTIRATVQAARAATMPIINEPLSYRMKIEKFKGGVDEDYDVWRSQEISTE